MRHARGVVRSDHVEAAWIVRRPDRAGKHAGLLLTMRVVPGELHRAALHGRSSSQDVVAGRAARRCPRRYRERATMADRKSRFRRSLMGHPAAGAYRLIACGKRTVMPNALLVCGAIGAYCLYAIHWPAT